MYIMPIDPRVNAELAPEEEPEVKSGLASIFARPLVQATPAIVPPTEPSKNFQDSVFNWPQVPAPPEGRKYFPSGGMKTIDTTTGEVYSESGEKYPFSFTFVPVIRGLGPYGESYDYNPLTHASKETALRLRGFYQKVFPQSIVTLQEVNFMAGPYAKAAGNWAIKVGDLEPEFCGLIASMLMFSGFDVYVKYLVETYSRQGFFMTPRGDIQRAWLG
jgi:hypothetical protein